MLNIKCFSWMLLVIVFFSLLPKIIEGAVVDVYPVVDNDVVLENPYMGYQVSYHQETEYYNYSTIYLRASASCKIEGETVYMEGLNWNTLNPSSGVYDFSMIDNLIDCCEANNKFGHIRMRNIVGHDDLPSVPTYLEDIIPVSNGWNNAGDELEGYEVHYYACSFLEYWGYLVEELRKKITDVRWINMIDIGSVGWYGEWFNSKLVRDTAADSFEYDPNKGNIRVTMDSITRIVRMFTGGKGVGRCMNSNDQEVEVSYEYPGFPNQYIFINEGDPLPVRLGLEDGAGWRYDAIGIPSGQSGYFYQWRYYIYPLLEERWKYYPNSGEFPQGLDISVNWDQAVCQAKSYHISSAHDNHVDKPSPEDYFEDYFRLIGYRIWATQVTYDDVISFSSTNIIEISMTFTNGGTSPAYKKYPLFIYVKETEGNEDPIYCQKFEDVDIREILPDEVTELYYEDFSCDVQEADPVALSLDLTLPSWLSDGVGYALYFSFMEDVTQRPIQLAMKQKDDFGRYYIGTFEIQGSTGDGNPPVGSCAEEIDLIPIEQSSHRPSLAVPFEYTKAYLPTQDAYSCSWSEGSVEKVAVKYGDREGYIQFDLTDFDEHFNKVELSMVPFWRGAWDHVFHANLFYEEWTESECEDWDTRPSTKVSEEDMHFLGNYTHNARMVTVFDIDLEKVEELMVGKKFTIYLYASELTENEASYGSTEHNEGLVGPYLTFYGENEYDDNGGDDVTEDSSKRFYDYNLYFSFLLL